MPARERGSRWLAALAKGAMRDFPFLRSFFPCSTPPPPCRHSARYSRDSLAELIRSVLVLRPPSIASDQYERDGAEAEGGYADIHQHVEIADRRRERDEQRRADRRAGL